MGNPKIQPQDHLYAQPEGAGWQKHNGWLGRIGGEFVALGAKDLPPPSKALSPRLVDLLVPDLGLVRIHYEAVEYRHHRSSHWGWSAKWADRLDAAGTVTEPKAG